MSLYQIIIKVSNFSVPFPLKLTSKNNYLLYPGDLLEEIQDLEDQILFNEKKIEEYQHYKDKEFLEKDRSIYCYIGFKLELEESPILDDLIKIIWDKIKSLLLTIDYILSNFHNFDEIYIFNDKGKFIRGIKLDNADFWIRRSTHLNFNLVKDLGQFLSIFLKCFDSKEEYLDDFVLFLRGKFYIEPSLYNLRKGRRYAFDNLSDIWESVEHISNTYWKQNSSKFQEIQKIDSKANNKVNKILHMFTDLSCNIEKDEEVDIKYIYTKFYNVKKHETADLTKIDLHDLSIRLTQVIYPFERLFAALFKFYPDIIEFKKINNLYFRIIPKNKREDFSTSSGIEKRINILKRNPQYYELIRFIEYETLEKKVLKFFSDSIPIKLKKGSIEKSAKIKSLRDYEIKFLIFKINSEKESYSFGEIYEFYTSYNILRVIPFGTIYPKYRKENLELKFTSAYIDFEIKD